MTAAWGAEGCTRRAVYSDLEQACAGRCRAPGFLFAAPEWLCYARGGLSSPSEQASAVARAYRAAAPWLNASSQFLGAALVGVGAGFGVDRATGSTTGYGVLVGGLLGSVLGGVAFVRASMKLLEKKP